MGVIWCEGARSVAGALGGFCVAVFMLALKDNGLIASLGGRYALIAGTSSVRSRCWIELMWPFC